jgi:hypothetical protein
VNLFDRQGAKAAKRTASIEREKSWRLGVLAVQNVNI